ncbi:MAG: leucine-rich repeat domain-containing protein [Thermoguttaceae bacterium]|nr:leucine-rich repeat domain-containing protein [Thermoguttaceae bacterium]
MAIRRNEAKGTDGALKISAAFGKGKAVKRCKITACVVGLGAAFGVGAFDGVPTESVAASQADSNVATPQDGIQRGPVAFEKMGPGEDTRIASRKIAPVYRKLIIGKDLSPEKIASQLRSALFAAPQFFTSGNWTSVIVNDEGEAVWSFFDEFEVEPENPYFKAEDGVLLSKDGKTLYRCPAKKRGATYKLPDGVEVVEEKAFAYCGFERIELPESLRTIKKRAFFGCDALKSATLPANVATLGVGAFEKCGALSLVEILGPLNVIDGKTFENCVALSSVDLPKTLKTIGSNAFANCGALSTLDLPEGLRGVGPGAFSGCGVKKMRLPASFDGAGSSSSSGHIPLSGFKGALALELEVDPNHSKLISCNGCVLTRDGKTLLWGPTNGEGELVVPEGVEAIEDDAFYRGRFSSVKLPESLRKIDGAFYGCDALTKVSIPQRVETVWGAFRNCDSLREVEILSPTVELANGAFEHCDRLEAFEVPASNAGFSTVDGALLSKDGKTFYAEPSGKAATLKTFAIPNGVERIVAGALPSELDESFRLTIPASVKEIGVGWKRGDVQKTSPAQTLRRCAVEVSPESAYFSSVDGMLLSKDGKTFYSYPASARATTLRIPKTVETLESFSIDSKHLVKIVAPSVRVVKERAVEGWSVESVELSEKLEVVWTNSFLIRNAIDVGPVKIPNDAKVERAKNARACARLERFNGEPIER